MPARRQRAPDDDGLSETLMELAAYAGFAFTFHLTDPKRSAAGLLDVLAARYPDPRWTPRLILAECKRDTGWQWSGKLIGRQRSVFLGLLAGSWWPDPIPAWWLESLAVAERTRGRVAFLPAPTNRGPMHPEIYLLQPWHMEHIKTTLWRGYPHGLSHGFIVSDRPLFDARGVRLAGAGVRPVDG